MSTILSAETEAALDRIVARSGRSRDQLANDALMSYVAWYETEETADSEARGQEAQRDKERYEANFIDAVKTGLNDEASGRVIDHDEFFERWHADRPDGPRTHTE
ncbi:hypothetical protein Terro_1079 [Terriglobus roseus DSM 18391]|uniref:Uncharacterized protein n=1 Tax=Terriglobus roseus (strain DSM 18391 / NRRL B-41598 / KBS 63) TaxID=926566 RepID=I3ZDT2_TERRK|nr:hypothetical protein [Terriglobus roseus]AFL87400.1 hypothetical protein Terro_1079 [Terriglobus roseus DSM 18391]